MDVGGSPGLEAWYGQRVPVLVHAGVVIAQLRFDADEVLHAIVNL